MILMANRANLFYATFRLLIGTAFLLLFFAHSSYAQETTYSDIWAVQNEDGSVSVWGMGVSDDTPVHGYEHFVEVSTTLTGPNGSYGHLLSSNGYSDTLVDLTAVAGEYHTDSFHGFGCGSGFFRRLLSQGSLEEQFGRMKLCSSLIRTWQNTGLAIPVVDVESKLI